MMKRFCIGIASSCYKRHSKAFRIVLSLLLIPLTLPSEAQDTKQPFKAGVSAIDVSPQTYPVRVNGGFLERQATQLLDPLYARAVALSDGQTQIVFCVVDSCMMPQDLIDQAKKIASKATGLSTLTRRSSTSSQICRFAFSVWTEVISGSMSRMIPSGS